MGGEQFAGSVDGGGVVVVVAGDDGHAGGVNAGRGEGLEGAGDAPVLHVEGRVVEEAGVDGAIVAHAGQPLGQDADAAVTGVDECFGRRGDRGGIVDADVRQAGVIRLVADDHGDAAGADGVEVRVVGGDGVNDEAVDDRATDQFGAGGGVVAGADGHEGERVFGAVGGFGQSGEEVDGGVVFEGVGQVLGQQYADGADAAGAQGAGRGVGPGVAAGLGGGEYFGAQRRGQLVRVVVGVGHGGAGHAEVGRQRCQRALTGCARRPG